MTFIELEPISAIASTIKPERVYINGFKRPGKPPESPDRIGYRVVIGRDVVRRLGWQDNRQYSAAWGTGEDRGKMKLSEISNSAPGWKATLSKAGYLSIRITRMPDDCTLDKFELTAVLAMEKTVAIGKPYLLIELPKSFYEAPAAKMAAA